jgi:hypothetical protein
LPPFRHLLIVMQACAGARVLIGFWPGPPLPFCATAPPFGHGGSAFLSGGSLLDLAKVDRFGRIVVANDRQQLLDWPGIPRPSLCRGGDRSI